MRTRLSRSLWVEAADRPLVEVERVLASRRRAKQCCCFCCSCPLSEGVYWALTLLCVEALVQLMLFLARPPWLWRVTPFILFCFLLQVATRCAMLALSAFAFHKLRQGRSVVFILRMQLRGLVWLCILELVVMGVSLAEEHLLCDTPLLEQMRNRHEALDEPLCELGSDLFDVSRAAVSVRTRCSNTSILVGVIPWEHALTRARPTHIHTYTHTHIGVGPSSAYTRQVATLAYCGWIVHSLARGLLDAAATGPGPGRGSGRLLQRVTCLAKFRRQADEAGRQTDGEAEAAEQRSPSPSFTGGCRPAGAEAEAMEEEGAAPAAAASPVTSGAPSAPAERQVDRLAGRQADRQSGRQVDRQSGRPADRWRVEEAAAPEATGRGKKRRMMRLGKCRGRAPAEPPGAAAEPSHAPPRTTHESPTRLSRHRILSRLRAKGREGRIARSNG